MTGNPGRDILLDTGPLVALLDQGDPGHHACVGLWHDVADRCITTDAVVTEATHLVGRAGALSLPLELLLAAGIPVVSLDHHGQEHAVRLMRRYGTLPMDYADATLVVIADLLRASTVFTLDRRGFTTYRPGTSDAFRILPDQPLR
jgi:predicted nucleic acid-binding protein